MRVFSVAAIVAVSLVATACSRRDHNAASAEAARAGRDAGSAARHAGQAIAAATRDARRSAEHAVDSAAQSAHDRPAHPARRHHAD